MATWPNWMLAYIEHYIAHITTFRDAEDAKKRGYEFTVLGDLEADEEV